ncbi:MAG: hypothetical protein DWQ19_09360 [Crenarchaeota archaeon]|nr:MAG: hypothetical protein DWQ19_09360 [Thermoproteota archaeon]
MYFHISPTKLSGVLSPSIPRSAKADGEPLFPRICVSPTVSQCMLSKHWVDFINIGLYVYSTDCSAVDCWKVVDSKWTDEKWILGSAKFEFKTFLSPAILSRLHNKWRRHLKKNNFTGIISFVPPSFHLDWLKKQKPPKIIEKFW